MFRRSGCEKETVNCHKRSRPLEAKWLSHLSVYPYYYFCKERHVLVLSCSLLVLFTSLSSLSLSYFPYSIFPSTSIPFHFLFYSILLFFSALFLLILCFFCLRPLRYSLNFQLWTYADEQGFGLADLALVSSGLAHTPDHAGTMERVKFSGGKLPKSRYNIEKRKRKRVARLGRITFVWNQRRGYWSHNIRVTVRSNLYWCWRYVDIDRTPVIGSSFSPSAIENQRNPSVYLIL